METKFTKAIEYFNSVINQVEKGSKEYRLMCLLKYRYIQDY
jgi:hypothetical protein